MQLLVMMRLWKLNALMLWEDLPISSGSKLKFLEFHNSANHLFTKIKCLLWSDSRAIVPVKRKIMLFVVFIFKDCLCTENWYWDRICTLVYVKHFGPFITSLLWENKMNRCTIDIHEFIFCVLHLVHENLSTITLLKLLKQNKEKSACKRQFAVWKFNPQYFEPYIQPYHSFYMNPFWCHPPISYYFLWFELGFNL